MRTKFIIYVTLLFVGSMFMTSCGKNEDEKKYLITAENGLNVRATPSANGKVLGKLDHYETVEVDTIVNDWAKINYEGESAYVNVKYIEKQNHDKGGVWLIIIPLLLASLGGYGKLKKDGTLDRRYKMNR